MKKNLQKNTRKSVKFEFPFVVKFFDMVIQFARIHCRNYIGKFEEDQLFLKMHCEFFSK